MRTMTCEQLHKLSRDELIDIILRQQEIIEQFEARVAQMEAQAQP